MATLASTIIIEGKAFEKDADLYFVERIQIPKEVEETILNENLEAVYLGHVSYFESVLHQYKEHCFGKGWLQGHAELNILTTRAFMESQSGTIGGFTKEFIVFLAEFSHENECFRAKSQEKAQKYLDLLQQFSQTNAYPVAEKPQEFDCNPEEITHIITTKKWWQFWK